MDNMFDYSFYINLSYLATLLLTVSMAIFSIARYLKLKNNNNNLKNK